MSHLKSHWIWPQISWKYQRKTSTTSKAKSSVDVLFKQQITQAYPGLHGSYREDSEPCQDSRIKFRIFIKKLNYESWEDHACKKKHKTKLRSKIKVNIYCISKMILSKVLRKEEIKKYFLYTNFKEKAKWKIVLKEKKTKLNKH